LRFSRSILRAAGLLTGAIIAAGVLAACGGSASNHSSPARTASLQTMVEAQAQLMTDPNGTIALLHSLGVDSVRVFMPWSGLAPAATSRTRPAHLDVSSPAAYPASGWAPYDAIVRAAAAGRVAVDLTLEGPAPLWATSSGAPHGSTYPGQWRPDAAAYGGFVHAVGRRYSGTYKPAGQSSSLPRVTMWSIWNEPNYGTQLAPEAIDNSTVEVAPSLYRALVDAAWSGLRAAGHGGDTILIGELAPRGVTTGDNPGNFNGMVPLRFVRALYCVNGLLAPLRGQAARARGCPAQGGQSEFATAHPGLFHASGFALHLYPQAAEPPNSVAPDEPDFADLATVGRFEKTVDRIVGVYGATKRFAIYDTEFGYKTNPPYKLGVSYQTATGYLNWSEYLHWRDPRVRTFDQYLLTDPVAHSSFDTGLETSTGRRKPTYAAFQLPLYLPRTSAKHGDSLEVWGAIRAAGTASGTLSGEIQFAADGHHFRDVHAVSADSGDRYFDVQIAFPSSGSVRLSWAPAQGPAVHSRSIPVTIR
jgi:hypothetical protein